MKHIVVRTTELRRSRIHKTKIKTSYLGWDNLPMYIYSL